MSRFKFTKANINSLALPTERKQEYHYDTDCKGLGICVGAGGTKTYFIEKKVGKKTIRKKIGFHGPWVPETVRKHAGDKIRDLDQGIDPRDQKNDQELLDTTLAQILGKYLDTKNLKPKTKQIYKGAIDRCFEHWLDKPIISITKNMVEQRYTELLNTDWQRGTSGTAQAHQAMRTLRAVLNYARVTSEDSTGKAVLPVNPVDRLKDADLWRPVEERETYIKKTELKAWYRAVMRLKNTTMRDFLLVALFSGLRRNEVATLQWHQIDFNEKVITIPAAKRKKVGKKPMKALVLPMTSYLETLLKARHEAWKAKKVQQIGNDFVFPGEGKGGHIVEVKKSIDNVIKNSGVTFSTHDLRRTYATLSESLDVPFLCVKRLLGHTTDDITSAYVIESIDRLRQPAETIASFFEAACEINDCAAPSAVADDATQLAV